MSYHIIVPRALLCSGLLGCRVKHYKLPIHLGAPSFVFCGIMDPLFINQYTTLICYYISVSFGVYIMLVH
jgi:hypothetical protein